MIPVDLSSNALTMSFSVISTTFMVAVGIGSFVSLLRWMLTAHAPTSRRPKMPDRVSTPLVCLVIALFVGECVALFGLATREAYFFLTIYAFLILLWPLVGLLAALPPRRIALSGRHVASSVAAGAAVGLMVKIVLAVLR